MIRSFAICFSLVLAWLHVSGIDLAGANISYKWVAGNQYEVRLTCYRICSGYSGPDSVLICISSISNNFSDTIRIPQIGTPVILPSSPYLPPVISSCQGGSGFGIKKFLYQKILSIPSLGDDWIISYTEDKPPTPVVIIPTFPPYRFYIETKIDNLNYPNNSSIEFTSDPTFQYCIFQPAWDLLYSVDDDGDSINYSISPTFVDSVICVAQPYIPNFLAGYNPPGSSTPMYIHPTDGWLHFNPDQLQVGFITIKVDEYRNNILINQTTVTHVAWIENCLISDSPPIQKDVKDVLIYPVLTNSHLNITYSQNTSINHICILDRVGRVVLKKEILSIDNNYILDVKDLESGIYFIGLTGRENGQEFFKKNFRIIKL